MEKTQEPSVESIKTSGELAAMGAAIRAILRAQYGRDPETLRQMRDAAKSGLSQAAALLDGHPGTDIFTDAANTTLDELFGVKPEG